MIPEGDPWTRCGLENILSSGASCEANLAQSAYSLRTNGVNTNGVAAKVMSFDWWGKKVHKIDRGWLILIDWYPKSPCQKFAVTPLVLTPFVPFRKSRLAAKPKTCSWLLGCQWPDACTQPHWMRYDYYYYYHHYYYYYHCEYYYY